VKRTAATSRCSAALAGAVVAAALATFGAPARAAEKAAAADAATAPDDQLLEFLGAVETTDEESGDWLDFLSRTDIDKVAKRAPKPASPGTPRVTPPRTDRSSTP
jgi:hypothetical protein